MKALRFVSKLLVLIGALNWGLVGFFNYNLIGDILGGPQSSAARFVFALVGLAGLLGIAALVRCCCGCGCGCCGGKGSCKK
ncbi:MAG: DUF378 domain-containing protein [Verrucomicrobiota bacterium]|nr:DUF378 domain-containing protein [Verrucomicrobiota bacterium]